MKYLILSLSASFFLLLNAHGLAPIPPEVLHTYERAGRIIAFEVPYKHLTRAPFSQERAGAGLTNFLQSLDFDRTYFMAEDIHRFEQAATNLTVQLREGNLALAIDIYDTLIARISNRLEFVEQLLERGFDLDTGETYTWRRREHAWPADQEEWDDIWRRKVKNQYLSRIINEKLEAERKAREEAEKQEQAKTQETEEPPAQAPVIELVETIEAIEDEAAETETPQTPDKAPATKQEAPPPDEQEPDQEEPGEKPGEEPGEADDLPAYEPPTLEESILNEYRQHLNVLNDNDAHWLLPLYLSSFLRAYDPHSDYLSKQDTEDFDISMKLSLVGIGALLTAEDGAAKVVRIIPGGPADRDGRLQPGDKIIAVGQGDKEPEDILHWPLSRSVRRIRGEKDTRVVLIVIPASDASGTTTRRIELVREEVRLEERAAKGRSIEVERPDGSPATLGVIQIPDFYADMTARGDQEARSVTRDVREELAKLRTNDIAGLILDLRNNGGGSLPEAISLSGLFIDRGPVVQVKTDEGVFVLPDSEGGVFYDGPLLLLVNRQSASAAEIFAGAMQDYGRALVVGDSKTHGKGTVQSLFPLRVYNRQLGSLKLTTARYYRIAGGSTQKKGVVPDIIIPSVLDTMEIGEDFKPGALPWTVVEPAIYQADEALAQWRPLLTERSEKRRARNPRFQAYEELLEHLARQRKSRTVSLDLDERLPMARREREIAEFIADAAHTLDPETNDAENDEPVVRNDLILEEGRNILLDMIALLNDEPLPPIEWLLDDPVEAETENP